MFQQEFWQRLHVQPLSCFLLYGDLLRKEEPGSLAERYRQAERSFAKGLEQCCTQAAQADWSEAKSDAQRALLIESVSQDLLKASETLDCLYFEAGLRAGCTLTEQLKSN